MICKHRSVTPLEARALTPSTGLMDSSCPSSNPAPWLMYLEGDVGHGLGQVVGLQAVPVIQVFAKKYSHLQGN